MNESIYVVGKVYVMYKANTTHIINMKKLLIQSLSISIPNRSYCPNSHANRWAWLITITLLFTWSVLTMVQQYYIYVLTGETGHLSVTFPVQILAIE